MIASAKFKVLHIIPSLDKLDGGPATAIHLIAQALSALGVEVHVASTKTVSIAEGKGVAFGVPVARAGFTAWFFKRQTSFYKVSLPLLQWLKIHIKDYDLIHIHGLFTFSSIAAAATARHAGVPYIIRTLGILNIWEMSHSKRWFKHLSLFCIERKILNNAAAIHYTSQLEYQEVSRLKIKSRARVTSLGVKIPPDEDIAKGKSDFFESHAKCVGHRLCLFLSRLDPKKGLELLLPAFRQVIANYPDALLVIAGEGQCSYVAGLKEQAKKLGLADHVVWTGFLDEINRLQALSASTIFILPSRSENFGIALLEAMSVGLPCISTPQVALASEVAKHGAVLLASPSPSMLAEKISYLLDDPSKCLSLGHLARKTVVESYSLDTMGNDILAMYQEIIKSLKTKISDSQPASISHQKCSTAE